MKLPRKDCYRDVIVHLLQRTGSSAAASCLKCKETMKYHLGHQVTDISDSCTQRTSAPSAFLFYNQN